MSGIKRSLNDLRINLKKGSARFKRPIYRNRGRVEEELFQLHLRGRNRTMEEYKRLWELVKSHVGYVPSVEMYIQIPRCTWRISYGNGQSVILYGKIHADKRRRGLWMRKRGAGMETAGWTRGRRSLLLRRRNTRRTKSTRRARGENKGRNDKLVAEGIGCLARDSISALHALIYNTSLLQVF